MGIDAVVILRPKDHTKIRKHVAPKEPADLLTALEDGTILLRSRLSYRQLEDEPHEVREWLEDTFKGDLHLVHDDARGVLVFPDICEPDAETYDELVEEIEPAGFWVPLTDDWKGKKHADVRAEQEAAEEDRAEAWSSLVDKVKDLIARKVDPGAPEAQSLLGDAQSVLGLGDVSSMLMEKPKGMDVWCPLVKRRTPVRVNYEGEVNELIVLPDKSTAIDVVDYGTLDDMSWRLSVASVYAHWIDEHSDPRGVPLFSSEHLKKVRGARSYDAAIEALGRHVKWITPMDSEAREVARRAKLDNLLGPSPKKTKAKAKAKPKAKAKAKPKTRPKVASKPKKTTKARRR